MKSDYVDLMLSEIGESMRRLRLQRNLMQQTIAERSGVSIKAVRNLESGSGVSLKSFLAICRTLGKTDWIKSLPPPMGLSPIEAMKRLNRPERQRAASRRTGE